MHLFRPMGFGLLAFFAVGCPSPADTDPATPVPPTVDTGIPSLPFSNEVEVMVTLDGEPVEGAWVGVGGGMNTETDGLGLARVFLDGGTTLAVSHPEARTRSNSPNGPTAAVALERFSLTDNPLYVFQDPGVAGERGNTSQCGHCHGSMVTDWTASPHRGAASNTVVHDVFAGTIDAATGAECTTLGGAWRAGLGPGTHKPCSSRWLDGEPGRAHLCLCQDDLAIDGVDAGLRASLFGPGTQGCQQIERGVNLGHLGVQGLGTLWGG